MANTKELRKNANKLQEDVKALIEKFVNENGYCDLNIDTQMHYVGHGGDDFKLTKVDVNINVTV